MHPLSFMNTFFPNKFSKTSFVFLLLLFIGSNAQAASVFKVTKGDNTVYIGGTFHLLTENDYPLPAPFAKAYKASSELYFETDIAATQSPAFMQQMMGVILNQNGETLKNVLDATTYAKVEQYASERGLDINQFLPLNATGLMLTITIMEYQSRGFVATGVDEHFFNKAKKDNKTIAWFESIDEQLAVIDSFDDGDPNGLVNYTLAEVGKVDEVISGLHGSWRKGDMNTLAKLGIESFQDYPDLYQNLLVKRNNNWMKKLVTLFDDNDTEFVLVGVLHLPGESGVLTQLEALGYKVEKLK